MLIDTAEVLWALHILPSEKLPQIATEWLLAGFDTEAIRLLAGLTAFETEGASILFERVLRELERPVLSTKDAVLRYTQLVSVEIKQNIIDPYDGAKKIWQASLMLETPLHEVDPFIYAASELEERPEERDFFISEIIKEAHLWAKSCPTEHPKGAAL